MSQERVRRYWDDQAARFDAMIAPVERRFLAASREWAAGRARGAVLEVAVGTGLNLAYYGADARITAVELSDGMLDGARHRAARHGCVVDFAVANGERLPFADASFDAVVCTYSLCGFRDPRRGVGDAEGAAARRRPAARGPRRLVQPALAGCPVGAGGGDLSPSWRAIHAPPTPDRRGAGRADRREQERLHHGIIERVHARR